MIMAPGAPAEGTGGQGDHMSADPDTRPDKPVDRAVFGTPEKYVEALRHIHVLGEFGRGSDTIEIRLNQEFIEQGEHHGEALALLGVDRAEMDQVWERWARSKGAGVGPPDLPVGAAPRTIWDARHSQDGAYWRIEAHVDGLVPKEVEWMAYANEQQVTRTATFRTRVWTDMSKSWFDVGAAGFHYVEETRTMGPAGAVGMFYSGIEDEDVDATARSINALQSARQNLEAAHRQTTTPSISPRAPGRASGPTP